MSTSQFLLCFLRSVPVFVYHFFYWFTGNYTLPEFSISFARKWAKWKSIIIKDVTFMTFLTLCHCSYAFSYISLLINSSSYARAVKNALYFPRSLTLYYIPDYVSSSRHCGYNITGHEIPNSTALARYVNFATYRLAIN